MLHVISESGAWEKYNLDVQYNQRITSEDAHDAVARGDIEFVGGNHVSTYGRRARGDDWVYLGQTVNYVPGIKLVVQPDSGINGVADLKHKKIASAGMHPSLNDWLYLKQHGLDIDHDDVEQIRVRATDLKGDGPAQTWTLVRDKQADAAFSWPPGTVWARRAGLRVLDIDPMPMIYFTTISSGMKFVERHPDIVERFLKALIEGIHFFKTQPERSMKIIEARYANEGELDDETSRVLYRALADALESKLYPSPLAIANVYEEGIRQDPDAKKMQPMELWDLHFLRRLEDSGFMRQFDR